MKLIRFKGKEYIFSGDSLDEDGFVAEREAYRNGEPSFAHWVPEKGLLRFGDKVGGREDIEILGDAVDQISGENALDNILFHPGWDGEKK